MGSKIQERIAEIERELRTMKYNKSTEGHFLLLRGRLAELKRQVEHERKKSKQARAGKPLVEKSGDATVLVLGAGADRRVGTLCSHAGRKQGAAVGTMSLEGASLQLVGFPYPHTEIANLVMRAGLILLEEPAARQWLPEAFRDRAVTPSSWARGPLVREMWQRLGLIRVFLRPQRGKVSPRPMVLPAGATLRHLCRAVHTTMEQEFRYALLRGPSARHPDQRVGLDHRLAEGDQVTLVTK
ncbi:MAG: TGS domain-containing protein [Halobacteria archaeon]